MSISDFNDDLNQFLFDNSFTNTTSDYTSPTFQ